MADLANSAGNEVRSEQWSPAPARKNGAAIAAALGLLLWTAGCATTGSKPPGTPPPPSSQTPTITSFSPVSGPVGTAVTVSGTSLTGATQLSFNGTAASIQSLSATQITTAVPSGATSGKISVTTPNGTATSAGSFSVAATPAISGIAPASGTVGTTVTITGSNFTGATKVAFNGTSATFQVVSASQISASVPSGASTGKVSVATPGGTATSAGNFTVTAGLPTITGLSPVSGPAGTSVTITGTNFTGVTGVKFNGTTASFTTTDTSHVTATVPNGATTGTVSVTATAGTATSSGSFTVTAASGLDLSIDGLYITQSTQNYPAADVPLVLSRSAWVRVFAIANQSNTATPQVSVQFTNGGATNSLTINAPGSGVPTSVDTEDATKSWNASVPAAWIQAGVQITATVDPANQVAETVESNNQFTANPVVKTLGQWKITLIPVKTADGRLGTVETATRTKNDLVEIARRLYPMPDTVDVTVGSEFDTSVATLSSDGTGWNTVLSELRAKQIADGATSRHYYGFVNPNYSSGVAGLGYIGAPAAIGWDKNGAEWVLAHEEGHNFGRQHSPCGGPASPDLAYPYAGGIIGVPGWDAYAVSGNLKTSANHTDIMGYCSNQWISDYVYQKVLDFRLSNPFDVVKSEAAGSASKPGLLVWGRIEGGKLILEPAFQVAANGPAPKSGPYTWEALDAQGRILESVAFAADQVADAPFAPSEQFAFVVPASSAVVDALGEIRVSRNGSELVRTTRSAQAQSAMTSAGVNTNVQELAGNSAQIDWDAVDSPVVMVRDATTGEVRGFLRGGSGRIQNAPKKMEIQFSDGVHSRTLQYTRQSPQ